MNRKPFFRFFTLSPFALMVTLLLCTAALTACSGPSVALTGTVTDAYTGEPVAADLQIGRTQLATDPGGMYTTSKWRTSDTLEVTAPGYEPSSIPLETHPEVAGSEALTITLDTELRPNILNGRITDAYTGEPLEGVRVSIPLDSTETLSTTTDADGQYTLASVPEEFTLTVNAPDYSPVEETLSRVTAFNTDLRPSVLSGTVTDQFSEDPVADVTVTVGDATTTTNDDGVYELSDIPTDATEAVFDAEGYATVTRELEQVTELDAVLRPDVLTGNLVDGETGEPINFATIIATETLPGRDVAFTRIDNSTDGAFTLEGLPETGYVQVLAPGYSKAVMEIKPGNIATEIELEPLFVKAVYVTAAVASSPSLMESYLDLIDQTELNAIVIDLKSDMRDDLGLVYYDSQVPLVQELEISADYVDMSAILSEAKKRNIYTIARVQIFSHDNALADARPEWAIQDAQTGEVYADYPGPGIRYAWLDPWNRNVWDYNIQLSLEAIELGFDEVNFDYIRYPDARLSEFSETFAFSQPTDPVNNPEAMFENIANFMSESQRAINGAGAFFSVDVFGRALVKAAIPVSQNIEVMAPHADYICPMPYPSLWWSGYLGFDNPTAHPYEVIYGSVMSGQKFVEGQRALLRPWLQDHTDPWQGARVVEYGPAEVRAQIDAAEDTEVVDGWMLYDSANTYTEEALKPE
jgi:protocatechuate 3,4-dioxygenase beta subunit